MDNTLQDTYTEDELLQVVQPLAKSANPKDKATLSLLLFSSYSAGRGDDARERLMCELSEPLQRDTIGESGSSFTDDLTLLWVCAAPSLLFVAVLFLLQGP